MGESQAEVTQYRIGDFISASGTLYQIEAVLGCGGMGEAYRAFDRSLNVVVVIKVLQRHLVGTSVQRRFEFEARAIARIESSNVVRVTRLGVTDDGAPFYVMEYLVGPNVTAALKKHPAGFRMDMALNVAIELLRGLEDIHERGIVHCDIKPDNLILHHERGRMVVKVIDFGVMLVLDGARDREPWAGTPRYSAPEQIEERTITPRTDLFAAGLVLFEMLTGRRPYESFGAGELAARKRAKVAAPRLSEYGEQFPPALVDAVAKSLSIDPFGRFKDAREMSLALEKISSALDRKDALDALTEPDLIDVGAQLDEAARPVTRMELENATDPDADLDERMRALRAKAKLDRVLGYIDTQPSPVGAPAGPHAAPKRIVHTEPMASAPARGRAPWSAAPASRPVAGEPTRQPVEETPHEELSPSSELLYADGRPAARPAPTVFVESARPRSGVARRASLAHVPRGVRAGGGPAGPGLKKQLLVFFLCLAVFLAGGAAKLYHHSLQRAVPPAGGAL
ncbi:MAG: protein kinase [Labilithrix sp.]|nr:protein kinase [Labilithrix sp.]